MRINQAVINASGILFLSFALGVASPCPDRDWEPHQGLASTGRCGDATLEGCTEVGGACDGMTPRPEPTGQQFLQLTLSQEGSMWLPL